LIPPCLLTFGKCFALYPEATAPRAAVVFDVDPVSLAAGDRLLNSERASLQLDHVQSLASSTTS
jgi:hypothetical protein